jgi:hypothetical protein
VDDVLDQFGDEMDALQDAAVSTMTRLLRETLQDNIPQLAEEFDRARAEEPAAAESSAVPFSHAQKEQDDENSTSSIVESVRNKV